MKHLTFKIIFLLSFALQIQSAMADDVVAYAPLKVRENFSDIFKVKLIANIQGNDGSYTYKANNDGTFDLKWIDGPNINQKDTLLPHDLYYIGQAFAGLKADDLVYSIKDSVQAKILGVSHLQQFAIEILDGDNRGTRNWSLNVDDLAIASGCFGEFCVGKEVSCITRSSQDSPQYSPAKIVAIGTRGRLVISTSKNQISVINTESILQTTGCLAGRGICAGQLYYDRSSKAFVKNLGFDTKDNYILDEIQSGPQKGVKVISTNENEHVSLEKTCREGLCVGETYVLNTADFKEGKLLGFQKTAPSVLMDFSKDGTDIKESIDSRLLLKEKKLCSSLGHYCIGDKVLFLDPEMNRDIGLTINGIKRDNSFTATRDSDKVYYDDVALSKLAEVHGCDAENKYCVGKNYFIKEDKTRSKVRLTGLKGDGNFRAIRLSKASAAELVNVDKSMFLTEGCTKGICYEKDFKK